MEAKRILQAFGGGPSLEFLLAMSGQPEPIEPFLAAAAAERGYEAKIRTLPFNTLSQSILVPPREGELEVYLLFPWDLVPETDWRSGFPVSLRGAKELLEGARDTLDRIRGRSRPTVLYVDAPVPELLPDHHGASALRHHLRAVTIEYGAALIREETVSLESLFRSGSPFASGYLGDVSRQIVSAALSPRRSLGKVLVTDFDNTLWHGVVGEDGVEGLHFGPTGLGYPHFIYQTFLKRLRKSGILLVGVTKNDPDLAMAPLARHDSVLKPDDFVRIVASYNAKSSQIAEVSHHLNLGLDSFAFVDDNPVELAEVERALPTVQAVAFPSEVSRLPLFFGSLSEFFHRESLTSEDRERTEMYRRRLQGLLPQEIGGADLTEFLSRLEMRLSIGERSTGDRDRAVQLVNKTNQFNMNGIRRSDEEVATILANGGRLFTASLSDRHGSHGEILACLLDGESRVRSFVLSCRVFQRRVEYAFLVWLAERIPGPLRLEYVETERNEPFRRFLQDPAIVFEDGQAGLDLRAFAASHGSDLSLFEVHSS